MRLDSVLKATDVNLIKDIYFGQCCEKTLHENHATPSCACISVYKQSGSMNLSSFSNEGYENKTQNTGSRYLLS